MPAKGQQTHAKRSTALCAAIQGLSTIFQHSTTVNHGIAVLTAVLAWELPLPYVSAAQSKAYNAKAPTCEVTCR